MRFDSNGVRLNYEVFGDGRPIVLVHGFARVIPDQRFKDAVVEFLSTPPAA